MGQILHVAVALVLRHCAATDSGHASVCLRRRLRRGGRVVVVGWRFGTSPFTNIKPQGIQSENTGASHQPVAPTASYWYAGGWHHGGCDRIISRNSFDAFTSHFFAPTERLVACFFMMHS